MTDTHCPLCESEDTVFYHRDTRRGYLQCRCCRLVFVESRYHLNPAAEKAEYDLHRNSPEDQGYRQFLRRTAAPLIKRLPAQSRGLDFGCGPGPTLSVMLEAAGHAVDLYDIFYARDEAIWENHYRFITATEVVEHLARPGAILQRLWQCLESGGVLALMTKLVKNQRAFSTWHYKNDPTHISFFSKQTFAWLSRQWRAQVEFIGADVILITKP